VPHQPARVDFKYQEKDIKDDVVRGEWCRLVCHVTAGKSCSLLKLYWAPTPLSQHNTFFNQIQKHYHHHQ